MATSAPAKPAQPTRPDARSREQAPAAPAPRPRRRNALKFGLIGLVLLVCAGGAAWFFVAGATPAPAKAGTKAAGPVDMRPPAFLPMDNFTVNLQQDGDAPPQYLQVGLTLKLAEGAYDEAIRARMPELRNRILLLLSGKKAGELSSVEGKQALAEQIRREVTQALGGSIPANGLAGVLFTSFLIQ